MASVTVDCVWRYDLAREFDLSPFLSKDVTTIVNGYCCGQHSRYLIHHESKTGGMFLYLRAFQFEGPSDAVRSMYLVRPQLFPPAKLVKTTYIDNGWGGQGRVEILPTGEITVYVSRCKNFFKHGQTVAFDRIKIPY